jgi:hypothetical protein
MVFYVFDLADEHVGPSGVNMHDLLGSVPWERFGQTIYDST